MPLIELHEASADEASKRLRTGLTPLVIEPLGPRSSIYHFDPTRPEASAARQILDDVLERARGGRTFESRAKCTSPSRALATSIF